MACAECMKMCCLGGKNSVVKGLTMPWPGKLLTLADHGSWIANNR